MQTERTRFTLLSEGDLPAMMDMAREPDTFKYLKRLGDMSEEAYLKFLQYKLDQIKNRTGYHWAIWQKDAPRFIGCVNVNPVMGTEMIQIGCQLKRAFWGQGYASELLTRALHFAVKEWKLPVVYGLFQKENNASRRILRKLGFVYKESKFEDGLEIEVHWYKSDHL